MRKARTKAVAAPTWADVLQELRAFAEQGRAENEGARLGARLGRATQTQRDLVWQILDATVPGSFAAQTGATLH